jgi:hypothetical protein
MKLLPNVSRQSLEQQGTQSHDSVYVEVSASMAVLELNSGPCALEAVSASYWLRALGVFSVTNGGMQSTLATVGTAYTLSPGWIWKDPKVAEKSHT